MKHSELRHQPRHVNPRIQDIREKIEINPKEPRYVKVVWGLGYKIDGKQRD